MRANKLALTVTAVLMALILVGGSATAAPASILPDSDQTGTLTVHKFVAENFENLKESSGRETDEHHVPEGAQKIAGISFKLEKLVVKEDQVPTTSSPKDSSFAPLVETTDLEGKAYFTDLEVGYYLVSETVPGGYSATDETFVVSIPYQYKDENQRYRWNWDVHVYPKNRAPQPPVELWQGSITIIKESSIFKNRLEGATFKIAQSEAEARAGVFVQRSGRDITTTTNSNGIASFDIPKAGEYYIVEVKAPQGYSLLKNPVKVVVGEGPDQRFVEVAIANQVQVIPPISNISKPSQSSPSYSPLPKTGDEVLALAFYVLLFSGTVALCIGVYRKRG